MAAIASPISWIIQSDVFHLNSRVGAFRDFGSSHPVLRTSGCMTLSFLVQMPIKVFLSRRRDFTFSASTFGSAASACSHEKFAWDFEIWSKYFRNLWTTSASSSVKLWPMNARISFILAGSPEGPRHPVCSHRDAELAIR